MTYLIAAILWIIASIIGIALFHAFKTNQPDDQ